MAEFAGHITLEVEINVERGEATCTGSFYPRSPSRANTMPVNPQRERPQRRNSLRSVDSSSEDEYERLRQRFKELEDEVKELESKVEILQLQVQEGRRGRERLTLEMETLRFDALLKEAESIIRKMELLGDQNSTEALSVPIPNFILNTPNRAGTTQLNPLPNDAKGPEIGVEGLYPRLSPPTIPGQPGSANHQRQSSWSPSGGEYTGYPTDEHTHLHQVPFGHVLPGWAPHVYLRPVEQSQYPPFDPTIGAQNDGQPPHAHGNNSQQSQPRSLGDEIFPYVEENTPHQPWLPETGGLGHTYSEYAYGGSTSPIYEEASHHLRQPSWPRGQQSSAEGDDKFCGGFNPYLYYQPR